MHACLSSSSSSSAAAAAAAAAAPAAASWPMRIFNKIKNKIRGGGSREDNVCGGELGQGGAGRGREGKSGEGGGGGGGGEGKTCVVNVSSGDGELVFLARFFVFGFGSFFP